MPYVCKPNGEIQCQGNKPLSLEQATVLLIKLIGKENLVGEGHSHSLIVPKMCGLPGGIFHHFEITEEGEYLLSNGIMGRVGFRPCPGDAETETAAFEALLDVKNLNIGSLVQLGGYTSATTNPVLIRELIGRGSRIYQSGDLLTKDYIENRVNIELSGSVIMSIWLDNQ